MDTDRHGLGERGRERGGGGGVEEAGKERAQQKEEPTRDAAAVSFAFTCTSSQKATIVQPCRGIGLCRKEAQGEDLRS